MWLILYRSNNAGKVPVKTYSVVRLYDSYHAISRGALKRVCLVSYIYRSEIVWLACLPKIGLVRHISFVSNLFETDDALLKSKFRILSED